VSTKTTYFAQRRAIIQRRGTEVNRPAFIVLVVLVVLVACSSGKPHAIEDVPAGSASFGSAAIALTPISHGAYRAESAEFAKGDVQVRVEWKDTPTVARASPGRTTCGTPRAPAVAPTTTWGIPEAIVWIDVDHGKPLVDAKPRIVLEHCALAPRVALAGASMVVASAADAPAQVALETGSATLPIELPVAGHSVEVPLTAGSTYELVGRAAEPAWIVAAPQPYYAITEASGQVMLRDVPVGTFAVRALVPARGGEVARSGHGTVTVAGGSATEVTVVLEP
jgi:hypothetical protein